MAKLALMVSVEYFSQNWPAGPIRSSSCNAHPFACVFDTHSHAIFNRPGVAGAVLYTASSFIDSLINSVREPFPPDLHDILNHKR